MMEEEQDSHDGLQAAAPQLKPPFAALASTAMLASMTVALSHVIAYLSDTRVRVNLSRAKERLMRDQ